MKKLIGGGLAALAVGLVGCGGNAAVTTPSTTSVAAPVLPVSALASGVTLPAESENDTFTRYRDHNESWRLHGSFDSTVSHLDGQLPDSGQDFLGLGWCKRTVVTEIDKPGFFGYPPDEEVAWEWGNGATKLRIHVRHADSTTDDEDIRVDITRNDADRSDCDAEKDEAFIDNLSGHKGWPDRAEAIATKRAELIRLGHAACEIQERDNEGLIATAAKVMDTYKVSGDEAGSVAVAAFDVYCPELS
jgi:hypothetical protein